MRQNVPQQMDNVSFQIVAGRPTDFCFSPQKRLRSRKFFHLLFRLEDEAQKFFSSNRGPKKPRVFFLLFTSAWADSLKPLLFKVSVVFIQK